MNPTKSIYHIILSSLFATVLFVQCREANTQEITSNEKTEMKISEKKKWSERMAESIMLRNEKAYQIDQKDTPKWDYVHGLVLLSFLELYNTTDDIKYFEYVNEYADDLIDDEGNISTYKIENYNIDMINAGKILFELYEKTKDEKYMTAMKTLRLQLSDHPRTKSKGFWHKKIYPNQMWLDGLYMGQPFYARYTMEFENGEALDDVAMQFDLIQKHALDSKTGLLYHGWDESKEMDWADKETGTSPNFWSRSIGWYAMALVDVLDYFPEDHPKKAILVGYLNDLAEALSNFQDESGLWYQVTDKGPENGNYLEASGSSMFAYSLAKGVNKGYLSEKYKKVAEKAFNGLTKELIKVDDSGETTITQACAVAGLGGDPYRDGTFDYYVNERKQDNDPKATGPFILAAIELNK